MMNQDSTIALAKYIKNVKPIASLPKYRHDDKFINHAELGSLVLRLGKLRSSGLKENGRYAVFPYSGTAFIESSGKYQASYGMPEFVQFESGLKEFVPYATGIGEQDVNSIPSGQLEAIGEDVASRGHFDFKLNVVQMMQFESFLGRDFLSGLPWGHNLFPYVLKNDSSVKKQTDPEQFMKGDYVTFKHFVDDHIPHINKGRYESKLIQFFDGK